MKTTVVDQNNVFHLLKHMLLKHNIYLTVLSNNKVFNARVIRDASSEKMSLVARQGQAWNVASSAGLSEAGLHMM